ncbi:MAG: hypothetical protein K2H28_06650 [Ruminococcus sp.]|nr:hypothetical protein [Ruminococcus sp.]
MNDEELQIIRNRCEKATGEPWIVLVFDRAYIIQTAGEEDLEITGATDYDYDFIANARHDIITLLDEIENIHSNQYTLNDNELEKISNRLEKANSELWIFLSENREIECGSERYWDFIKPIGKDFKIYGATVADYEFISHSRQDVITLLDEIEKLRSHL